MTDTPDQPAFAAGPLVPLALEDCVIEFDVAQAGNASMVFLAGSVDFHRLAMPSPEIARVSSAGVVTIRWDRVEEAAVGCPDALLHAVAQLLLEARRQGRAERDAPPPEPEPPVFAAIRASA